MGKVNFSVFYDGPALREGRMNVRDLAPALLALGDAVEAANRVLNQDRANVSVHVKTFPGGCFGITLELLQSYRQQIVDLFSGSDITAAVNILVFLGLLKAPTVGLIGLLKRAKGRPPARVRNLDSGSTVFEFSVGEEPVQMPHQVALLYSDYGVRDSLRKTLEPLNREGIEALHTSDGQDVQERVTRQDVPSFVVPQAELDSMEEPLVDSEDIRLFTIVSLSFKEDNKWRLYDGASTVNVIISDRAFLDKVDASSISFSKGDKLKVRLRTRQSFTADGIKTEYEALEILEHRPAIKQIRLPLA